MSKSEFELKIENLPDNELIAMLENKSNYTEEAIEIAERVLIERGRGYIINKIQEKKPAERIENEKSENEKSENEKSENEKSEKQEQWSEDNQIKDYPAIRFLSKISSFIAKVGILGGIAGYIIWLERISRFVTDVDKVAMFFLFGVGTFLFFIYWKAVSELLIIIVDIARDLRKTRLNKES